MMERENRHSFILVADDDSAAARNAVRSAIQIARNQKLAIRGLYVVDEAIVLDTYDDYYTELPFLALRPNGTPHEPASRKDLMVWFKTQGEAALQWLEMRCAEAGVPVCTELLAGGVPELILRQSNPAQLLALGRCGHSHKDDPHALGHKFLKIAHNAHLPILVGGKSQRTLHRLLLAYHGQANPDMAIAWTIRLHHALSAEVIVLIVHEGSNSRQVQGRLEEIEIRLAQSGLNEYRLLSIRGQPESKIAEVAASNDVHLILMGGYRHKAFVERPVSGNMDRLLRISSLPVLIA